MTVSAHRPGDDDIAAAVERAERAWAGVRPFDLGLRRINCFHDAVVVEAVGDGPRDLVTRLVDAGLSRVALDTFLPHLTLGVFEPGDPAPLREAVVPIREADLGRQSVTEATLCLLPASRTTILDPWEVVGSVRFAAT